MRTTPLAESLRPRVFEVASAVTALFEPTASFDPATSNRHIRIATPDLCVPLMSPLIAMISAQAPNMSVEFVSSDHIRDAVLGAQADVGLVFGTPRPEPNLAVHPLAALAWCTFTKRGHAFAKQPTAQTWATSSHVVVGTASNAVGPIEKAIKRHKLTRHVLCYAPNFTAALSLARDCKALFTTLRDPFEPTAKSLGLQACPTPFDMPPAPAALVFRKDYGDGFRCWLQKCCLNALAKH